MYTAVGENTCKEYHRGWRRRGGGQGRRVDVESRKGAFAVVFFLIFGAVVMKIASKLFLSLRRGGASGGVSCRGGSDGGGEISGRCRGARAGRSVDQ